MNKNKKQTHLNSNIENGGSDPMWSEDHKTNKVAKSKYRSEWENRNTDFHENIDELILCLAMDHKVRAATISKRYEKFFNEVCLHKDYFERPPLNAPIWEAFLKYERGGLSNLDDPLMFKEDIYYPQPQPTFKRDNR